MKSFFDGITAKAKSRIDRIALVFGAVLFSAGFSFEGLWLLSWVALVPLAVKIFCANKSSKRVYHSLFCFFFVFYVCAYSWLVSLYPLDFAGLGNVESILVIVTGLTLVPALHSAEMSLAIWHLNKLTAKYDSLYLKSVAFAFGYVLGEFVQGLGPLGFPWARIYVSQTGALENLQSAKIFGSYFVTFAVVLVNCFIASAIVDRNKAKRYTASALAVFAINFAFGSITIVVTENSYCEDNEFTPIVLQGNVSSYDKWSSASSSYERYKALAAQAGRYMQLHNINADFALVPETAFPVTAVEINDGKMLVGRKVTDVNTQIAQQLGCPVISGVFVTDGEKEYNSLVCYTEDGSIKGMYHKTKLVPFGEFVPYRSVISTFLPFLSDINMLSSDLSHGSITLPVDTGKIKTACLVCFDSVFSESCRKQVKNGAEVISVSTNDSWYKTSKALNQHLSHAIMRAIENHRPVVRSANTGISALVEPTGKTVKKSGVNTVEYLTATLHKSDLVTPFSAAGDVTLYASFVFAAAMIAVNLYKKRRT